MCVSVWISLTFCHKVPYHKGKAEIDFGGNCLKILGTSVQKKKTNIFDVSGQSLVCKCMDLSDIVPQGSISQKEGWDYFVVIVQFVQELGAKKGQK